MKRKSRYPLIRLPEKMDMVLYLIVEELKSEKFFKALQTAGIDDVYYQVHLASPILRLMGVRDVTDDLLETYINIVVKASDKMEGDRDSMVKQALKVYRKIRVLIKDNIDGNVLVK
jgi:hypothetical protein